VARANLVLVFGSRLSEAERVRIARESIENSVATLVMLFWAVRLNTRNFPKYVEIDAQSREMLRRAQCRGNGIIYATLHYGDWELMGLSMALLDAPLTVAAQQTGIPGLDRLLSFCRSRTGNRVVPGHRGFPRLLKAVHSKHRPAVLNDLNAKRNHGIWVNFFGFPVYNHPTVGALAIRTGASIIYGLAHPLGRGRSRLEWFEIPYTLSGDRDRDVEQINQACMDLAESVIRRRPEHWHWSYKRWKRRPTAELGGYPYYSKFFDAEGQKRQKGPRGHELVEPS